MTDKFHNLLIVDDEASMRHMLRLVLEQHNYRVSEAQNGAEAIKLIYKEKFDFILSDIRMPDMDGLTFLDQPEVRALTDTTIIMMSAYGSIDTALACMKRGAYDYISKPFKPDEVVLTLRKAEERQALRHENQQLKKALRQHDKDFTITDIVHTSEKMSKLLRLVQTAAKSDSSILISGETGTGKELIAKALHSESGRKGQFLAINCFWRSTAARLPPDYWKVSCSVIKKGHLLELIGKNRGFSPSLTTGHCFLMRLPICLWNCSRNSCGYCRKGKFARLEQLARKKSTPGSLLRQGQIFRMLSKKEPSGATSIIVSL